MRITSTINDIVTEVQALYKNLTGRTPLSAIEGDIVQQSIIDALQIVLLEYGVDTFKFHESATTVNTVAAQAYIDLPANAYKVVNGSVRIAASGSLLSLMDETTIFQTDPEATTTGRPTHYAYTAASNINLVRLALWPIPDTVYTITMLVLSYPADTLASFPAALQSAIKFKAKSLSCLGLGIVSVKIGFDQEYESLMAKLKDGYEFEGPRHVGRSISISAGRTPEERIS
jgi:hypothetical protein